MRTIMMALVICLGTPALAASPLQGRWEITMPSDPTFSGEMIVDAEGRAACAGASLRYAQSFRSRGYVSLISASKAEVTLTGGKTAGRIRCAVQSADVLNCDDMRTDGSLSPMYYMRRIGPGPVSLLPQ